MPDWPHRPYSEWEPLAQALADAMAYGSQFDVHLTVYGALGYLRGTHTDGTESVHRSLVTGRLWWKQYYHMFGDAQDATGAASWKAFRNW